MSDRSWVYQDNLICIYNYINRHRKYKSILKYITMEQVTRLVTHYAKVHDISMEESAEKVKRLARGTGELKLLNYINKVVRDWIPYDIEEDEEDEFENLRTTLDRESVRYCT